MMSSRLSRAKPQAPTLLTTKHDVLAFCSGEPVLDDWLKKRALRNQNSGASRTYVVIAEKKQVIAYYSLAVGSVRRQTAMPRIRRNMPDPIPVMILARLAVDQAWQGKGLGHGLLKDAVLRTLQAADIAGIRAMLVHALSEDAKRFYQYFGFKTSGLDSMTLMALLPDLA